MFNKKYFFIFASFVATFTSVAMEREIERSVADLGNQVAIAGTVGCTIFDKQSRAPIHVVADEEIFNIAANKEKTLLALSTKKGILLHNIKTSEQHRPNDYIKDWNVFVAFSSRDDTLFSFRSSQLFCYSNNQMTQYYLPLNCGETAACDFISCHPTKNEILYMSSRQKLSIAQLGCDPLLKIKLKTDFRRCVSGDYAPDGHTIALFNSENNQENYFICDLANTESPLPAHQLIFDDKNYCSNAFHPHYSMIFLLSKDGYMHCFDYIQCLFIASTKKLSSAQESINDSRERKRLDCDQQGKQIVVALNHIWTVVNTPQNNFYAIWQALHQADLPKELRMPILHNVLKLYKQSYDHFNLKALLDVTRIQPAKPAEKTEDPMVMETEIKQIKALYVRPMINPIRFDPSDHLFI